MFEKKYLVIFLIIRSKDTPILTRAPYHFYHTLSELWKSIFNRIFFTKTKKYVFEPLVWTTFSQIFIQIGDIANRFCPASSGIGHVIFYIVFGPFLQICIWTIPAQAGQNLSAMSPIWMKIWENAVLSISSSTYFLFFSIKYRFLKFR